MSRMWRLADTHFKPSEASDYFPLLYSPTSLNKTALCSTDCRFLHKLSPAFHQNASQILTGNVHLCVFSFTTKHLESVLERSSTSAHVSLRNMSFHPGSRRGHCDGGGSGNTVAFGCRFLLMWHLCSSGVLNLWIFSLLISPTTNTLCCCCCCLWLFCSHLSSWVEEGRWRNI